MERIENQRQTSTRITELSPAEAEKERGNELFKKRKFSEVQRWASKLDY